MSLGLLCWQEKECSSGRHSCWWPAAASAPAAPPQQEKGQRPPLRPVSSSPFGGGVRFHQGGWLVTPPPPAYSCPFCKMGPKNSPDLLLCTVWGFQRGSLQKYQPLSTSLCFQCPVTHLAQWAHQVSLYSTGWSLAPSLGGFPSSPRPCCSFRVFIALVIK